MTILKKTIITDDIKAALAAAGLTGDAATQMMAIVRGGGSKFSKMLVNNLYTYSSVLLVQNILFLLQCFLLL